MKQKKQMFDKMEKLSWSEFKPHATQLASNFLGVQLEEDWTDIPCPGEALHSNESAEAHCRFFLDGEMAPTLNCVHESCSDVVEQFNRELRSRLRLKELALIAYQKGDDNSYKVLNAKAEGGAYTPTKFEKSTIIRKKKEIKEKYVDLKDAVEFEIGEDIPTEPLNQAILHFKLFEKIKGNVVLGDVFCSGEKYKDHYKTFSEWIECGALHQEFIGMSTFSSFNRKNKELVESPYLVMESDVLSKEDSIELFKKIKATFGLDPILLLDSGGKSIHAWYNRDEVYKCLNEENHNILGKIFQALGIDPAGIKYSQPMRWAGMTRKNGKIQELIYYNSSKIK